jgi:hypothetical protein
MAGAAAFRLFPRPFLGECTLLGGRALSMKSRFLGAVGVAVFVSILVLGVACNGAIVDGPSSPAATEEKEKEKEKEPSSDREQQASACAPAPKCSEDEVLVGQRFGARGCTAYLCAKSCRSVGGTCLEVSDDGNPNVHCVERRQGVCALSNSLYRPQCCQSATADGGGADAQ